MQNLKVIADGGLIIYVQSSRVAAILPIPGCFVSGVRTIARSQLLGEALVSRIAQFPH